MRLRRSPGGSVSFAPSYGVEIGLLLDTYDKLGLHAIDVHIARTTVPEAPVRAMVIHGAGGYWGALGSLAARKGVAVMANSRSSSTSTARKAAIQVRLTKSTAC